MQMMVIITINYDVAENRGDKKSLASDYIKFLL